MFLFQNTGSQGLGRICFTDRDGSLNNDGPLIDSFRDQMHRAAGNLAAMLNGLFLDVEPRD